ncbi:MAG: translocation protein TolB [Terriglobia bacterium]
MNRDLSTAWRLCWLPALTAVLILAAQAPARAQAGRIGQAGQINTGTATGNRIMRLAVAHFPVQSSDRGLTRLTGEFNEVLWNDLDNSGLFQMISRSLYPLSPPAQPGAVVYSSWSNPPVSAQYLVFGNTSIAAGNLVVASFLYDVKNPSSAQIIGKRFVGTLNEISTRAIAHTFANEIIQALGGGVRGINLTRIAFISSRTGHEEVWVADYDGFNQHPITSYRSFCITPRWSPDDKELAFTNYASGDSEISIYSFLTHRLLYFPRYHGLNTTPAWSPDGKRLAFCSSMGGTQEIYTCDAGGSHLERLTFSPGHNVSNIAPVWNPKTGREIAFVSDRSGTPQIYMMNADGTNLRRLLTKGGDADAPAWSPNGLYIAFSWAVVETGNFDIYLMNIGSGQITQLTHNARSNDRPWWAPDGNHIVFQSDRSGKKEIWIMLADGTHQKRITTQGENWDPNWSN